ncbi:MAG: bis(5'-nucleosyl)-tetraphosphatase (symmetrical) YqeK [Spirochaetales bacterium]|nr:bis(5'-nucleosyl)-tetraphosphatase (symmetrical) YqeK [Spirochaetales bacterium]
MPLSACAGFTAGLSETTARLDAFLERSLSAPRCVHSRAVADLCGRLCLRFGCDPAVGYFTGLGHDAAREMPEEKLLAEARASGCPLDEYEEKNPVLLHAPVAAVILRRDFGVCDGEVLEAVRRHTLGCPDLRLLGKILFVADYCEPNRKFIDRRFRSVCFSLPLDGMLVYILDNEKARGHEIAPITRAMYDKLVKEKAGKSGEG